MSPTEPSSHETVTPDPSTNTTAAGVPRTMRAALHRRYGGPEVLEVTEVDTPRVTPSTVLVQVEVAALNPLDWHQMTGTPWLVRSSSGWRRPKKPITGVDVAGHVAAVGDDVTEFAVGDAVVGVASGAAAQYAATTADRLTAKPDSVSFDDAAGMGVAAITALQGLRDHGRIQPGAHVLINGASGGVGCAAIQLSAWMQAEVTAVCSTRNVDLVRSLGAANVVDYTVADFTQTDDRYDLIFDNQGNQPLRACRDLLKPDGTYLLVGGPKKNRALGPIGRMIRALAMFRFSSRRAAVFIANENAEDLGVLADLMAEGSLETVTDSTHELDDIAAAMTQLASGHSRGKIIIHP